MSATKFTTRVDIVRSNPFVATLIFETDYSRSMVRVSRDTQLGKYWVQGGVLPSMAVKEISEIDPFKIASVICNQAHRDRAERMGSSGVVVYPMANGTFYLKEAELLAPEDIRAFAQHVIEELDRRYVPTLDEVARAVEEGLIEMGEEA